MIPGIGRGLLAQFSVNRRRKITLSADGFASGSGLCRFWLSRFQSSSKAGFLGVARPSESTIRSSEKSNSPWRLKCCQVTAEPARIASIRSFRVNGGLNPRKSGDQAQH